MATREQADAAVAAVRKGVANKEQERIAAGEASQAGSRGNAARDAFQQR